MKRTTRLAAAALTAALALPTIAAAGDETVGTAGFNDDLAVTVVDGAVVVTGSATFGGEELVVAEDAAMDGLAPGAGSDLLAISITQDPDSGVLSVSLDTDLAAPATTPGLAWGIPIGGSSLSAPQLLAFSTDRNGEPGGFQFGLGTGGGINEDFSIADVEGHIDGSKLVWEIAPSALGVDAGDRITAGDAAFSTWGSRNAALSVLAGSRFDEAMLTSSFGVGGGATVKILDADGEIADQGTAKLRRGTFTRSVAGLAAGTYTVEVTTRYADAAVTETFTVTV